MEGLKKLAGAVTGAICLGMLVAKRRMQIRRIARPVPPRAFVWLVRAGKRVRISIPADIEEVGKGRPHGPFNLARGGGGPSIATTQSARSRCRWNTERRGIHARPGPASCQASATHDRRWTAYPEAVFRAFQYGVDFAMLTKNYSAGAPAVEAKHRYSSPALISSTISVVSGNPEKKYISTSLVERANLSMRMGMRRFTRLHELIQQEAGKPHARGELLLHGLQLREDPQLHQDNVRYGSGRH